MTYFNAIGCCTELEVGHSGQLSSVMFSRLSLCSFVFLHILLLIFTPYFLLQFNTLDSELVV